MSARHRAPGRVSTPLRALTPARPLVQAAAAACAAAGLGLAGAAPAGAAGGFDDTAAAVVQVRTYTVPAAAQGPTQAVGTGELIRTRLQVACDDASVPEWRFRDHVAGTEWHGWLPWSTAQSEPGWTSYVTSGLGQVGVTVEAQYEVRCTTGTWIGASQTSVPTQITRTT